MQLIFLDRKTLAYKDNGFVENTFEINLDLVIHQKSSFTVNKRNINTNIGDIVALKDMSFFYLGIIESIELADVYTACIQVVDICDIFNIEVPVVSYTGDLALYLENLISTFFINSNDTLQNLPYLSITRETCVIGELIFEPDKIMAISSVIELISKSYGVNLKPEVVFLRGRIIGIKIRIVEVQRGIKIKSNLSSIMDLVVNDSSSPVINKVIYYPKLENITSKTTQKYYLLTTGEISQNATSEFRYQTVKMKSISYSDADFLQLLTKAKNEMISSKLDHNISFNLKTENNVIKPLENLNLGDFVEFIKEDVIYDTVVTGIKFKDGFYQASITLGEYRIRLTEKIQLLNKSVNTAISNISVISGGSTDLDGGEY